MRENSHEFSEMNPYRAAAIALIRQLAQAESSRHPAYLQNKAKTLKQINRNLEMALRKNYRDLDIFSEDRLLHYMCSFFSEAPSKADVLIYLRLVLLSEQTAKAYLRHAIPLYLVRIIQKDDRSRPQILADEEITAMLNLCEHWVQSFPKFFPKYLLSSLVAYAQLPVYYPYEQHKKDHISQPCKLQIAKIVLKLAVNCPELCTQSGSFNFLTNCICDPATNQVSYDILCRCLFFLNEEKTRDIVQDYIDIRKIFKVFTEIDNIFVQQGRGKASLELSSRLLTQLSLARNAIITIMKSWVGLIYLGNDHTTLQSFLQVLKQLPKTQNTQIRKLIYSILQQLLSIGETANIEATFPHQQTIFTSKLISCYLLSLIQLLISHDLFKTLIELSGVDQMAVSQPAQRLLKKLSIYIFNYLPKSSKYFNFLISAATKADSSSILLKSSSSFIINKIGNFIYHRKPKSQHILLNQLQVLFALSTIFVPMGRAEVSSVAKSLNMITHAQKPNYRQHLLQLDPIPKEFKLNHLKWNWKVISDLLAFSDRQKEQRKIDFQVQRRMFKYLLRFYSVTRGAFADMYWNLQNCCYVKVAKQLIHTSISIPDNLYILMKPIESQFEVSVSYATEIQNFLKKTLQEARDYQSLKIPFFKTLKRELLLSAGLFSQTKLGYQTLLCQSNFFNILYEHLKKVQCAHVISMMLFYLDFRRQNMTILDKTKKQQGNIIGPKMLLTCCVKEGSKPLRLACIEIIRLLYQGEINSFEEEGFKLLLRLLPCQDQEISDSAMALIAELINQKNLLKVFLKCLQDDTQLKGKPPQRHFQQYKDRLSTEILIKLVGLPNGLNFINSEMQGWLKEEYNKWVNVEGSKQYCLQLEAQLNASLNVSKKKEVRYRCQKGKNLLQLLFLYKLPFICYLEEDTEVPMWKAIRYNRFFLYCEPQEFSVNANTQRLNISLAMGNILLDQFLSPTKNRVGISLQLDKMTASRLHGQGYMVASSCGVSAYIQLNEEINAQEEETKATMTVKRIEIQIETDSSSYNQELPLHIIKELTKSKEGLAFLKNKNFLTQTASVLQNPSAESLDLRAALWSLGYYGSTVEGIRHIIELNIIDRIIHISENCTTLSLRGTCRYILNMFCQSDPGIAYLSNRGYQVSQKYRSCIPKDPNPFFRIQRKAPSLYCRQPSYWTLKKNLQLPINQTEHKLYQSIGKYINSLSWKVAAQQVREILKSGIKVTYSFALLQNVITLETFYKLRYQARRNILAIFQEFIKSNEFHLNVAGRLQFLVGNDVALQNTPQ